MTERRTWQTLLGEILAIPEERERILQALGLARPRQLDRWVIGEQRPQKENVLKLLKCVPQIYRKDMIDLMSTEFPYVRSTLLPLTSPLQDELPRRFILEMIHSSSFTPEGLKREVMREHAFLWMADHLDSERVGLAFIIALCHAEENDQVSFLLDPEASRGTGIWRDVCFSACYFVGNESILVRCVQASKPIVLDESSQMGEDLTWLKKNDQVKSLCALPLLQSAKVAGCLLVVSTQSHFFYEERRKLLQQYAWFLSLAHQDGKSCFYDPDTIIFKRYSCRQRTTETITTLYRTLETLIELHEPNILELVQRRLEILEQKSDGK